MGNLEVKYRIRSKISQKAGNQRALLSSSPASIIMLLENLEEYYAGAVLRFEFVFKLMVWLRYFTHILLVLDISAPKVSFAALTLCFNVCFENK